MAENTVETWLGHIAQYDRAFKKWESRVEKILKRYRDEKRANVQCASFNILWSNVQTLSAATFARLPKPDVSRRFRDNDPVGRVASLILERALDYEIQHYADYRATLKECVQDRFLGGRATAWIRYDAVTVPQLQVTEDKDEDIPEKLDYECSPVDYVHYKDFGHSVARTWEEVTRVWRRVYMTMDAKIERFGEELAREIPLDSRPKDGKRGQSNDETVDDGSWIYEGWDKETKTACWFHKSMPDYLDERPDPLGLEGFFPCPRPLYATLTNDTLVPVPDFVMYQDQARELDTLSDTVDAMIDALKIRGVYDAANPELARIFTEGRNASLIPVKNWGAFAEKQGLKGATELIDLKPIYETLEASYLAAHNIKEQVYEITGVADIIRGQSDPGETATAQQIKGQFASLRLKSYQDEVADFATQLIQQKAQVMCNKFSPETLLAISAAEQLSDFDKQYIQPALQLLLGERLVNPNAQSTPLRSFRIEITSDSLIHMDEKQDQEARMQFLQVNGKFMADSIGLLAQSGPYAPVLAPLISEMWKFGATAFKVGKTMEGIFDETAEKLKQVAAQVAQMAMQPPPPTPQDQANMAKAQAEIEKTQTERQIAPLKARAEATKAQAAVIGSQADMVVAQGKVREAEIMAANPAAFQAPARPQ